MKKSTRFLLAAGATLAVLVSASSCGRRAEKEAEAERARKEAEAKAQKAADEAAKTLQLQLEKEGKAVYDQARDSVLAANGYKDVYNQFYSAQDSLYRLDNLSQKTILFEHVDTLIAKQVRQSVNEIESWLAKYKIWVDDKEDLFSKVESEYFNHVSNRSIANRNAEDYDEAEKANLLAPDLPYYFFGNSEGKDSRYEKYIVDWYDSEYGESRQKEIENGVLKIFDKMNQALDKAITAEIKKFAVYYPELDIEKSGIPQQYLKHLKTKDPLDYWNDRFMFDQVVESKLVIGRTISVYDSKLKVDFFGEEDATYKLVKVSEGKWQVVRTDKNGHVAKTPVFSHNVEYDYNMFSCGKGDPVNDSFWFEPGANMGVHITVSEVVWSKTGKDDRYPDPKGQIAAKRDLLAKEVARLEALNEHMSQISHQADSVARIKQRQYMVRRFHKK